MIRQEHCLDRIYGLDEYEAVESLKKGYKKAKNEAEKRSRKDKNGKNRQK